MIKILMFAGSGRKLSFNKLLIKNIGNYAKTQEVEVTTIDLADYKLPIYDGDYEEAYGPPDNAKKLHRLIHEHDAMIIASPEYNGLPSALLKNVIDWVSRVDVKVYNGKVAAIVSASPGGLGGLRGLTHLRTLLNNLNVLVIPQQATVGTAFEAFDDKGLLASEKEKSSIKNLVNELILIAKKVKS